MKKIAHLLPLLAAVCMMMPLTAARGQNVNISVTSAKGDSVSSFIHNWLVGDGVYVFNVKFNSDDSTKFTYDNIGYFYSNGYLGLQMDSGVVITTGKCEFAKGPNSQGSGSMAGSKSKADNALKNWLSSTMGNTSAVTTCGYIDFDFVSISPFVTVNYCFGSEEYPEFVCSSFNDSFLFLITGPDPNSPTLQSRTWNCAIIPHTVSTAHPDGISVTINAVNNGSVGSSGSSSQNGCYLDYSEFYVDNSTTNVKGVQYDAYTQKLSANAKLVPCAVYHMHIAVCNLGDSGYDSGVFMEKKSFNSPSAEVQLSHREADTLERSQKIVLPLTLDSTDYDWAGVSVQFGGQAVIEQDYTVTTDSGKVLSPTHNTFVLDKKPHSLTFTGTPTADLSQPKTIELYLSSMLCTEHPELKTYDTIRYLLMEDDLLRLRHDTIIGYDTCHQVGVEVALGTPPFSFHWEPEDGIDFPYQQYSTATITQSTLYKVSASDAKGHTDTTEIYVQIVPKSDIAAPEAVAPVVYPNPTSGPINVDMHGPVEVVVYNAQGVQVYSQWRTGESETISIDGLPSGIYTVQITSPAGTKSEKVIVR